jgi:hypothetical protein
LPTKGLIKKAFVCIVRQDFKRGIDLYSRLRSAAPLMFEVANMPHAVGREMCSIDQHSADSGNMLRNRRPNHRHNTATESVVFSPLSGSINHAKSSADISALSE